MFSAITGATVILAFVAGLDLTQADPLGKPLARPLHQSVARIQAGPFQMRAPQAPRPRPRARGSARQRAFAMIGAFGGLVAGGYAGVLIEGDRCRCDDPGLSGFVIGAPIGMIVGGIVGHRLGR